MKENKLIIMKKLFGFLCACCLMLTACQKELESLTGTKWEMVEDSYSIIISFTTDMTCIYYWPDGTRLTYTYDYTYPNIIMYPSSSDYATLKGKVSGNEMTLINMSTNEMIGIYKRM